jgi:predicted dehydrogenase
MSDRKLRWGILGTGNIAKKFAAALPESETGELVAVGSRGLDSAQAFAGEFGGHGVAGYQALVDDEEVEAVYLALPNGLHKEWSISAMQAGKDVLCEKPIALNAVEAEEMFAVATETGRILIEAFMYRAHAQSQRLIETVRGGAIGELRLMRSNFSFPREISSTDARLVPEQGGGALMDVGCYCVHLARQLAGTEPTEVKAVAHLHPMGVDDYASGTLKFGDDFLMTFTCGMGVGSDGGTHLAGTKGRVAVDRFWLCQEEGFEILSVAGESKRWVVVEDKRPLYAVEADAFAAAVRGEVVPWITAADSIGNMRVLDALRESAGVPVPG